MTDSDVAVVLPVHIFQAGLLVKNSIKKQQEGINRVHTMGESRRRVASAPLPIRTPSAEISVAASGYAMRSPKRCRWPFCAASMESECACIHVFVTCLRSDLSLDRTDTTPINSNSKDSVVDCNANIQATRLCKGCQVHPNPSLQHLKSKLLLTQKHEA